MAGLLSGAWFVGAAGAAAEESPDVSASGSAITGSAVVWENREGREPQQDAEDLGVTSGGSTADLGAVAGSTKGTPAATATESADGASAAAEGGASGVATDDGGGSTNDSDSSNFQDTVGEAAGEPIGSATSAVTGSSGGDAPEAGSQQRGSAASEGIGGTVAAVREVGRGAGHTVPISISAASASDAAAAVSEAAVTGSSPDGLPGLGMDGFGPAGMRGAVTLPAFDPPFDFGRSAGPSADAENAPPSGARSAPAETRTPSTTGAQVPVHAGTAAAFAEYDGPAAPGAAADTTGDDAAEPRSSGADRPDAAAVGSAVNTSQSGGGTCAGYIPAGTSTVPAAGSLQCPRPALADVPQDLGEQPTFSPD
ncbi:hypothetical protein [Streptomonospora litoralis]|uniref:hypothetical protein n=1 Tax=Streptomonospora litoralis TaxID=2498135 RepID=UPI0010356861|nr:hypothetical protein [Streptomonospora litoralis]